MCKYYLISNAIHLNKLSLNSLNIKNDDTIILFNHAYLLQHINHNKKILFIRETNKILTGIDNDLSSFIKVYIFITSEKSYFNEKFINLDSQKINYEIININDFIKKYHSNYPENNLPTCGFLGYLYLINNKNYNQYDNLNNFILVGFTGHHSNGNNYTGIEHNYNYEQKYYFDNKIQNLLSK